MRIRRMLIGFMKKICQKIKTFTMYQKQQKEKTQKRTNLKKNSK